MTVRLEPFAPRHLSALADLWVATWTAAYPAIDFAGRRDWFIRRIIAMDNAGIAIVLAFLGPELAGLVTVDRASGWIDQMLVGTAFQGTGTARALMDEAKRLSPPQGLSLDVNADNARAIAFYRREGFVRTGGRSNQRGAAIALMAWRPELRSPGPPDR